MTHLLGIWLALLVSSANPGSTAAQAAAVEVDRDRAELEAEFARLLTGSRLVGYFTQADDGAEPTGDLQVDSYTLDRVSKAEDGKWLFEARIEYGARSIPIRLALPVYWAGDTPVISVTDMGFPMLGTYSARVLFFGDQYVGVWSGKGYGGQMFGRVERQETSESKVIGIGGGGGAGGGGDADEKDGGGGGTAVRDASAARDNLAGQWPSFRGPQARGSADGDPAPIEWDLDEGTNVLWRSEVPGLAHSSPVIWGDRLFITTAVSAEGEQDLRVGLFGDINSVDEDGEYGLLLVCLDKNTGAELWSRTAWEGVPEGKRHIKGSHAAPSPATDGERVVAFFGGEGLYCYDMEGELLWERDFGTLDSGFYMVPTAQWGFSSSPIFHDGKVIVQCDVQQGSFVAALDAATGATLWRTERDDVPTWSTPTVDVSDARAQVICNGYKHAGGYDLETGKELWKITKGGDIPVPTPVVSHGLIFITNAHGRMAPIYAVDTAAEGTLKTKADDEPFLAWSQDRRGNYMQTPLVYGDEIYFCNDGGILACYDIETGEEHYRERLGGGNAGFTSSGIAANGMLYFASEEGDVHVVAAGTSFEFVGANSLGEECMASPAISDGVLFYRTRKYVVALGL